MRGCDRVRDGGHQIGIRLVRLRPDGRRSGARRSEPFQWRIPPACHRRRSQAIHRRLRDRNHAMIDLRRELAIYPDFLIAGGFPLLQRRIIEIGKPNGAFDLQRAVALEENRRRMRIDPMDTRMHRRIHQECEDALLRAAIGCHRDSHASRAFGWEDRGAFDAADDFMAGNNGTSDVRKLSIDDMEIGSANAASAYPDTNFCVAGLGSAHFRICSDVPGADRTIARICFSGRNLIADKVMHRAGSSRALDLNQMHAEEILY